MAWALYALVGAFFAGLTALLAKKGITQVDSNLATAIRTIVILFFAWGIVLYQGTGKQLRTLDTAAVGYLIASGFATGLSWLFFFRALSLADATRVGPIDKLSLVFTVVLAALFLHERITWPIALGSVLMTAGALCIAWAK